MEQEIRTLLANVKPDTGMEGISTDLPFESAGLDSLDQATFLLSVQEKFGVQISDEDASSLTNISAVVGYLSREKT